MLRPIVAAIALFGLLAAAAVAQDPEVRVFQNGKEVRPQHPDDLTALVVALVESSSVNSTRYAHPAESWAAASAAPARVHARFSPARSARVMTRDHAGYAPEPVDEVLFSLGNGGFPDHILLRTAQGYQSVTKYSPCVEARLVVAAGLSFPAGQIDLILKTCEKY